jgi:hypothetical protein
MSNVRHIAFEELAGNLTELLDYVRANHITLVVEYDSGEKLLIKPLLPTRPHAHADASDHTLPQPPNQGSGRENLSSMGAVHDLDPDSITPG